MRYQLCKIGTKVNYLKIEKCFLSKGILIFRCHRIKEHEKLDNKKIVSKMKTTIKAALVALTLLGITGTVQAQEVTYGIQVGSNYHMTSFGNKSVKDNNGKVGVSVAAFARIGDRIFFQPGIGASLLRKEYTFENTQKTPKFYQINLPLQVGYTFLQNGDFSLRGLLGPQLNYDLKTVKSSTATDYKKFSLDGRAGIGIDVSSFTVDAYYSHGFTSVDKTLDAKNKTVGIMVGYKF